MTKTAGQRPRHSDDVSRREDGKTVRGDRRRGRQQVTARLIRTPLLPSRCHSARLAVERVPRMYRWPLSNVVDGQAIILEQHVQQVSGPNHVCNLGSDVNRAVLRILRIAVVHLDHCGARAKQEGKQSGHCPGLPRLGDPPAACAQLTMWAWVAAGAAFVGLTRRAVGLFAGCSRRARAATGVALPASLAPTVTHHASLRD